MRRRAHETTLPPTTILLHLRIICTINLAILMSSWVDQSSPGVQKNVGTTVLYWGEEAHCAFAALGDLFGCDGRCKVRSVIVHT